MKRARTGGASGAGACVTRPGWFASMMIPVIAAEISSTGPNKRCSRSSGTLVLSTQPACNQISTVIGNEISTASRAPNIQGLAPARGIRSAAIATKCDDRRPSANHQRAPKTAAACRSTALPNVPKRSNNGEKHAGRDADRQIAQPDRDRRFVAPARNWRSANGIGACGSR
jgi:hypothetical protein